MIHITSSIHGAEVAGVRHPAKTVHYADDTFTSAQLEAFQAAGFLTVQVESDEPVAEAGSDQAGSDKPAAEPGSDQAGSDEPAAEPGSDQAGSDEPAAEPGSDQAGSDKPAAEPGSDQAGSDKPAAEPGSDQAGSDKPAAEAFNLVADGHPARGKSKNKGIEAGQ